MQASLTKIQVVKGELKVVETQFKPTQIERPTIESIRKLKGEINISSDDLREVMIMFMSKLEIVDLNYALITLETELQRRRWGLHENEQVG